MKEEKEGVATGVKIISVTSLMLVVGIMILGRLKLSGKSVVHDDILMMIFGASMLINSLTPRKFGMGKSPKTAVLGALVTAAFYFLSLPVLVILTKLFDIKFNSIWLTSLSITLLVLLVLNVVFTVKSLIKKK